MDIGSNRIFCFGSAWGIVMTSSTKQKVVSGIISVIGAFGVFVILLLHTAWGDNRYELKDEAIRKEIRRIDTQLTIKDTEILFAQNDNEKAKLIAIRAIYERDKEALQALLAEK